MDRNGKSLGSALSMSNGSNVRYVINADDQISFVDQSWHRFATENEGAGLTESNVLGRSLWDFISDAPTRQLYQQIVSRVSLGTPTKFTLRCDGPSTRRLLEMTISARAEGEVEFETRVLRLEDREPLALLDNSIARSEETLRLCAWCNRVNVGSGCNLWVEVEEATERLLLFERAQLPQLSHGICATCLEAMLGTLAAGDTDQEQR